MSILSAENLSLLLGDGATSESFAVLKAARVLRFELAQRNYPSSAIGADAWAASVSVGNRRAVIDGEALASDESAALRLRSLALSGAPGNFRLELSGAQTMSGRVVVTQYREVIAAGDIKQVQFRLETDGAVTIA
ncbi:MAG: phage tail tube protein [Rickettsiales bacterium]